MTELRLLGPVEVWADGALVHAGEPRRRAVLAALLVDVGPVVSTATLIDRVWGDGPPAQAARTLATHITRIRRVLEQAAGGGDGVTVVSQPGGYRLTARRDQVDLFRFRDLVEQARGCGDEQRATLLRQAMRLWRGDPLTGVPGDWAARTRERLSRERLDATAAWATAELAAGNPSAVLTPLATLADEHPLMEPLTVVLVRALVAAGRPTEALERCRAHRQRLGEEYGTDPSPELQSLYETILRGETGPPPVATAAATRPTAPAQLPADLAAFAGRDGEIANLDRLLARSRKQPSAAVVAAVSGTAGVGKTAFAVHWAHRVAEQFPDGQLYVDLRGFDPGGQAVDPVDAVQGFLDALGVPPQQIPPAQQAREALYRSLLAGRRILIVADNARDVAQVRPLLPGATSAFAVVTSRDRLTGLVAGGAHPLALGLPTGDEARALLSRRLGAQRVLAEPEAVDSIVASCARLPLALAIVAARAQQTGFRLADIAAELAVAGNQLDLLDGGDPSSQVRTVFSWSYAALAPQAARLFRLLGLQPGADLGVPAAASLAALPVPRARQLLIEVARANLVTETAPGRYGMHDLLRVYAAEQADDGERVAAMDRLLDHYLQTGYAAALLLYDNPERITIAPPRAGVAPEPLRGGEEAAAWFAAEHGVVLSLIGHADAAGLPGYTWRLAWTLRYFLHRDGRLHDWIVTQRLGLAAAQRAGDPAACAMFHRTLARAEVEAGEFAAAEVNLRRALEAYRVHGDRLGEANTYLNLGTLRERQGRLREALDHTRRALALFGRAGHRAGTALAGNNVGWIHALLGEYELAGASCRTALATYQEIGHRHGEAMAADSLGYVEHHLGDLGAAERHYRHALELVVELGDRYFQATVLGHLGDVQLAAVDHVAARATLGEALDILTALGHPDAETVRARLDTLQRTQYPHRKLVVPGRPAQPRQLDPGAHPPPTRRDGGG